MTDDGSNPIFGENESMKSSVMLSGAQNSRGPNAAGQG